ncbi:MAG: bifunctional riboflavin kinase/FAD synthetase [Dactylosporangium sp.]|nr:bifunctional riboflavin kinase/FAD synthetase [Dactylosporangium sp.]NNJ62195.1 bifunctional riboflavin kinase/FAD synthetase [Dactylosporangium sp.]
MRRWRGCEAIPEDWGRSVVTIGVFDGVHRGHQHTIGHAVKRAADLGGHSVVVTFDPHPVEVIRPGTHPPMLTEISVKADLIEALGAGALCVIPFTSAFAQLSAEMFVRTILADRLHASLVVVGGNFRFGRNAEGDVDLLRRLGAGLGFEVEEATLIGNERVVFSSTQVRACITTGDVGTASLALGRPYQLDGTVIPGDHRGRTLGFPTANLRIRPRAAVPADGVYAAWLLHGGDRRPAAVSVGTNPTFSGASRRVEAHVLDFDGDLYGERVAVRFVARLRPMEVYDAPEPLIAQIREDVKQTRRALSL